MIHTYNARTLECIYKKILWFFVSLSLLFFISIAMYQFGNAYKVQFKSGFHCLCYRDIIVIKVFLLYCLRVLKVPELAGFWLLSILLQFPLILFQLFNEAILIQPLERGVHIVLALLILIQVGMQVEVFFLIKLACDCQWLKYEWF